MSLETDLPLLLLTGRMAICRLAVDAPDPDWARPGELLAMVRTHQEFSLVCEERFVPPEVMAERGWRAFQVQGPLDFSLVGVLSTIATPLAQAGVSIFVISTYETDYILVRESSLEHALKALSQAGFVVLNNVRLST